MRLHTDVHDIFTVRQVMDDLRVERKISGVYADTLFRGSRKRARGFDLHLTADPRPGRRRLTNPGTGGGERDVAATWDEWGIVLNALFTIDPNMTSDYYADAEHFEFATGGRFANGGPVKTHDNHRWDFDGGRLVCKCGAKRPHGADNPGKYGSFFEEKFGRSWGERITQAVAS